MNTDHSDPQYRGFLAGEGFGSSSCHLEPHPTDNVSEMITQPIHTQVHSHVFTHTIMNTHIHQIAYS